MPLTLLDYTAPQNYITHVFGFHFPINREANQAEAVAYLKARLGQVFSLIPFLGGQIIHAEDGQLPRLVYSREGGSSNLNQFPDEVFDSQVIDLPYPHFPQPFWELLRLGVPAANMTKRLLWLLPESDPAPGDACHPVTLRATFIEGGVLLGFAFHHGVMDGTGTLEFLKCFATGTLERLDEVDNLRQGKEGIIKLAANTAKTAPVNPRSMDGYEFAVPQTQPVLPAAVAKILTISADSARSLKQAALEQIQKTVGPTAFVSVIDVLCGLTWLHLTRVRLKAKRISPSDTTHFATAVDIRRVMVPAIGAGYIGNMWLRALARSTVSALVEDPSLPVTIEQIASAAWHIRRAIVAMTATDPTLRQQHIAVATMATDPNEKSLTWPEVDAAVRRVISRHSTGLDATVGVGFGADVEFEIPGTGGRVKPAWVRRAYVPNEGAMAIMPRQEGAKGDADWEIWLALREEDMDALVRKRELGGYLSRPPA
ncbi:transferase family-domain-containing protein [Achaetomium macrosporum]|uniref:Transferase family-domain-containing protein n=1 Tax=Achaetomium macrosporum TaxID=79813 RepID=A0AAN7H999_9PEZI|nr:transferase family-domain-containing protein [Achaetomium macrosporum]